MYIPHSFSIDGSQTNGGTSWDPRMGDTNGGCSAQAIPIRLKSL